MLSSTYAIASARAVQDFEHAWCVLGCKCLQMLSAHVTARMIYFFASTLSNSNLSSRVCVCVRVFVCVCECECVCVWVYVPLLCPLGVCSLSLALSPTNAHTHMHARTHTHTHIHTFFLDLLPTITDHQVQVHVSNCAIASFQFRTNKRAPHNLKFCDILYTSAHLKKTGHAKTKTMQGMPVVCVCTSRRYVAHVSSRVHSQAFLELTNRLFSTDCSAVSCREIRRTRDSGLLHASPTAAAVTPAKTTKVTTKAGGNGALMLPVGERRVSLGERGRTLGEDDGAVETCGEVHDGDDMHASGNNYTCPDCQKGFEVWAQCEEHCAAERHAGWPKTKGLRKRCKSVYRIPQLLPLPTKDDTQEGRGGECGRGQGEEGMMYKCAEDGCGALFGKWMACLGHCKALNHAGWPNSAGKMKKRCTITSQARMRKREIEVLVVVICLSLCSFFSICPPPHPPSLLENIWRRCERSRISVDHSAASANVVYFLCVCVCYQRQCGAAYCGGEVAK